LHISTPEVYGHTEGWTREHFQFSPSSPYAVSRAACDLHLLSFFKAYGFPVIFTRAANVYGPGQQLYRIIPRALMAALTGKKLDLHGGGYSQRCFIHIDDVCTGTEQIALNGVPGEAYHLSTAEPISIRELVERVAATFDLSLDGVAQQSEERLGKDDSYLLDSSKLQRELGWAPQITLDSGIDGVKQWAEAHLPFLITEPLAYQHRK